MAWQKAFGGRILSEGGSRVVLGFQEGKPFESLERKQRSANVGGTYPSERPNKHANTVDYSDYSRWLSHPQKATKDVGVLTRQAAFHLGHAGVYESCRDSSDGGRQPLLWCFR